MACLIFKDRDELYTREVGNNFEDFGIIPDVVDQGLGEFFGGFCSLLLARTDSTGGTAMAMVDKRVCCYNVLYTLQEL